MFQISNKRLLDTDMLHNEAASRYLPASSLPTIITGLQHQTTLQPMDSKIKSEHFYFSVDVQKNAITYCKGIINCLGYPDNRFSIRDYLQVIHPAHAVVDGFYALAIFDCLANKRIGLDEIINLTHVSLVALLHNNGKYIYCKKESRALQMGSNHNILAFSNEFTIIKSFNNEPYIFRIYDNSGQRADVEKSILQFVKINFEKKAGFSVQELRILRRYASSENTTSEMIATSFRIEKSTVATYNKRILNKAENIFEYRFKNAQQVAGYLKEIGLI